MGFAVCGCCGCVGAVVRCGAVRCGATQAFGRMSNPDLALVSDRR